MTQKNKYLLPSGFGDMLFDEAEHWQETQDRLRLHFLQNGYRLVRPSAIEFEESLFCDGNDKKKLETFRMLDPLSNKMLGLRSDITGQIARLAMTRLSSMQRPIKILYNADVFKSDNVSTHTTARQITQVGIEQIGIKSISATSDVVATLVAGLKLTTPADLLICFSLPQIAIRIAEYFNQPSSVAQLTEVISKKDISSAKKLIPQEMADLVASNLITIESDHELFTEFVALTTEIIAKIPNETVIVDCMDVDCQNYHTDLNFTIYRKDGSSPVAGGGIYQLENGERCVGATIYLESLLAE